METHQIAGEDIPFEDSVEKKDQEIQTINSTGFLQPVPYTHYLPENRKLRKADAALFHRDDHRIKDFLRLLGFDLKNNFDVRDIYDDRDGQELGRRTFFYGEVWEGTGRNGKPFSREVKITSPMLSRHFRRNGRKFTVNDKEKFLLQVIKTDRPGLLYLQKEKEFDTLHLMRGTIGCRAASRSTVVEIE